MAGFCPIQVQNFGLIANPLDLIIKGPEKLLEWPQNVEPVLTPSRIHMGALALGLPDTTKSFSCVHKRQQVASVGMTQLLGSWQRPVASMVSMLMGHSSHHPNDAGGPKIHFGMITNCASPICHAGSLESKRTSLDFSKLAGKIPSCANGPGRGVVMCVTSALNETILLPTEKQGPFQHDWLHIMEQLDAKSRRFKG